MKLENSIVYAFIGGCLFILLLALHRYFMCGFSKFYVIPLLHLFLFSSFRIVDFSRALRLAMKPEICRICKSLVQKYDTRLDFAVGVYMYRLVAMISTSMV